MPAARALPPMRPSATAAAFLPSSVVMSSISPVAILAIMMALPIASAGRFSPLGPRGTYDDPIVLADATNTAFALEIACGPQRAGYLRGVSLLR